MNIHEAKEILARTIDQLRFLEDSPVPSETALNAQKLFEYIDDSYNKMARLHNALGFMDADLIATEEALIDLWKNFTPPTTKENQIASMDRCDGVIKRIIDRKKRYDRKHSKEWRDRMIQDQGLDT